jgi:hypothetical protein
MCDVRTYAHMYVCTYVRKYVCNVRLHTQGADEKHVVCVFVRT